MNHNTALITGASSGIGLELAKQFARHQHDLVLVARSEDKLRQLARDLRDQHGVAVTVIAKDLSEPDAPDALYREVKDQGVTVGILVNNAGFASYGPFVDTDLGTELREIQLNVTTLTHLSKLYARDMAERGRGAILNVASTAAFFSGPLMAVYYATKNYVLAFSEALANELADRGVTVTALCPGPTESDFQSRADMEDSKLMQNGMMSAAAVAEAGYRGLMAKQTVVVPGLQNKLQVNAPRFLPRTLATSIVRRSQEEK